LPAFLTRPKRSIRSSDGSRFARDAPARQCFAKATLHCGGAPATEDPAAEVPSCTTTSRGGQGTGVIIWQRDKLVGPTPSVAVASTRDIGRVGAGGRVKGLLLASKVAAGPAPPSHSRPSRGMRRVGALPATHSLTHHTHPLARARPPRGQRQPASACTHSVTRPIALELQIVAWLNTAC